MNTFGRNIRLTTFGESHGPAMGGILDGFPSNFRIDFDELQREVDLRAPGRDPLTSPRKEPDIPEFLSGISPDGLTLGTPIGFIVRNRDQRSSDYKNYEGVFRPNHADFTYYRKFGINDFRGGGRASARETVSWVIGGAFCKQYLKAKGITISARFIETNSVAEAKAKLTSTGGIVECVISGVPVGLGNPVFDKLHARLAQAMMGINAAHGFEYGDGIELAHRFGDECLDLFDDFPHFSTNHSGGILGGISNGMDINFKVYFKPTPTQMMPLETYNVNGEKVTLNPKGRHDPCVAMRGVAVVEAMAALVIADFMV